MLRGARRRTAAQGPDPPVEGPKIEHPERSLGETGTRRIGRIGHLGGIQDRGEIGEAADLDLVTNRRLDRAAIPAAA